MVNNKVIDYDFKLTTPNTFALNFIMRTTNRLMLMIFEGSKKKLKEKGVRVRGNVNKIDSFDVDDRYHKLLTTILRKQIKRVCNEVDNDGITILNYRCVQGRFHRDVDSRDWLIHIDFEGDALDKR